MSKLKLSSRVAERLITWDQEKPEMPAETAPLEEMPCLKPITRTDVGKVRKVNQDTVIVCGSLFGIADGMGGHNGGETASRSAKDVITELLRGSSPDPMKLEEAVRETNRRLYLMQQEDESLSGMGTTLTLLWLAEKEMLLAHVGDSRTYLLRNGTLRQITEDHSMVAEMVRQGVLTPAQAATHPMRNYITRAVGTEETIEVDMLREPRQQGDRWLICSDGLHGTMSEEVLSELLSIPNAEKAADALLTKALENGGRDNISLLILNDEEGEV